MTVQKIASPGLILRIGLAFVFMYAALTAFINPESYYNFVPSFVTQFIPIQTFLLVYGLGEVFLALWLLSGKLVFYAALASALLLTVLTVLNFAEINILFRNVAITTGALALASSSLDSK